MRSILVILSIGIFTHLGICQDTTRISTARNTIQLGLAGEGSLVALLYENRFGFTKFSFMTAAIGIGYTEEFLGRNPSKYLNIPTRASINLGTTSHFLELGIGLANFIPVANKEVVQSFLTAYPTIGFRVQDNKTVRGCFRIFYCPPINYDYNWEDNAPIFLPFGISFGKSF